MTKKKTKKKATKKVADKIEVTRNGDVVAVSPDKLQGFLDAGWVKCGG